jgi:hypothetical protein
MKKENVFKIVIIVVAVAITGGVVGFKFAQRAQAPAEQVANVQTAPGVSKQESTVDQAVPANWKTYTGDLSGLSADFVGKKISFNYPAVWGEVRAEKTAEGTAFDGPSEKVYDIFNISFSAGSQDKNNDFLTSAIRVVDAKKYSVPNDITFLQKIATSNSPVGDNDLKALNALGHGYGSTVFFGVNSAKKYIPKNIATSDQQIKGLTFFMQDNQAAGTDLSYDSVLLDQKSNAIIGGQFYVTSSQQDQLEKELNAIGGGNDKKSLDAIEKWSKKWETFINNSYTSNPDYMTQVKDIDLVMQSLKIQ